MIPFDWANMCQAVWRSPLLPLEDRNSTSSASTAGIGTGSRFKRDFLSYLSAYGERRTGSLVSQLRRFNFDKVRGALVASIPCKQKATNTSSAQATMYGWPALKDTLSRIPIKQEGTKTPHIIIQVGRSSSDP